MRGFVMHSALFVAKVSGLTPEKWGAFLLKAEIGSRIYPGAFRLAENVWLLNFQDYPASLPRLVTVADVQEVPYGILPFEHEPQWLPVGFDPNTIQGRSEET